MGVAGFEGSQAGRRRIKVNSRVRKYIENKTPDGADFTSLLLKVKTLFRHIP